MKRMKYLWTLCLALLAVGFTSCSDDDDSGAQMTISRIFLENAKDKDVPDREVSFARLGQLIRIEGSGFTGLKKVYINGYDTYFNNALVTDNNIWVTLNGDTPIDKASEDVRNTIILVKDNGQLVYNFIIRASAPSVTSVDNTLPQPGEKVTVYGSNLHETTKVTLPGGIEITDGIENDEDGEWYSFIMPAGVTESGSITSEGANGTAVSPAFFNDFNCYIINFEEDGHGELGSWSATYGSAELVDDPLNSGRGKVAMLIPQSEIDNGGIAAGARALLWATAGNDNANDDWTSRMYEFIPESTPASQVAIQFDIYVPEEWNETGQLEISLQNNLSNYGYGSNCTKFSAEYLNTATVWVPWLNEDGTTTAYKTDGWRTVTIPFSKFGNYNPDTASKDADKATASAATFQTICEDRNAGSYKNLLFFFVNSDIELAEDNVFEAKASTQKIYIDNLRVVSTAAIEVSDF